MAAWHDTSQLILSFPSHLHQIAIEALPGTQKAVKAQPKSGQVRMVASEIPWEMDMGDQRFREAEKGFQEA